MKKVHIFSVGVICHCYRKTRIFTSSDFRTDVNLLDGDKCYSRLTSKQKIQFIHKHFIIYIMPRIYYIREYVYIYMYI